MGVKDTVAQLVINATEGAAASTDVTGDIVDMQGFDEVTFEVVFGAITATAVTGLRAQQGAASDMSDAADLLGTAVVVADDDDNKIFRLTIIKPMERYVRLVVDRATADAVVAAAIAIKSKASRYPVTQHADVGGSETHVSPAEGTA